MAPSSPSEPILKTSRRDFIQQRPGILWPNFVDANSWYSEYPAHITSQAATHPNTIKHPEGRFLMASFWYVIGSSSSWIAFYSRKHCLALCCKPLSISSCSCYCLANSLGLLMPSCLSFCLELGQVCLELGSLICQLLGQELRLCHGGWCVMDAQTQRLEIQ